jgi:hypothetical protein
VKFWCAPVMDQCFSKCCAQEQLPGGPVLSWVLHRASPSMRQALVLAAHHSQLVVTPSAGPSVILGAAPSYGPSTGPSIALVALPVLSLHSCCSRCHPSDWPWFKPGNCAQSAACFGRARRPVPPWRCALAPPPCGPKFDTERLAWCSLQAIPQLHRAALQVLPSLANWRRARSEHLAHPRCKSGRVPSASPVSFQALPISSPSCIADRLYPAVE